MLAICTDVIERTGYGRTKTREEGGVGRMGISEGFGWGKVAFPSPVQRQNKRDECLICPLKLEVH